MKYSALLQLASAALVSAMTLESRQSSLVVFKTYTDLANCSPSPSQDNYIGLFLGTTADAESGECHRFSRPDYNAVKLEVKFPNPDFNFTSAYPLRSPVRARRMTS
ncbi:hypothetical protein B0I35DRAFT_424484 [Stachybotrys elegans]|uniref:Uncharacterized protein n=1 Tax=Stachybotrys elegans TaxID=80388 RepID=A0A8K0WTT3_9HYPO|nr:hypothetical protein B0I35DRAFT_424484 [Stachybotrys elegans]